MFLNILFNNVIGTQKDHVECLWMPQFAVTGVSQKKVSRLTDFNVNMKKGLYLSEDVFLANN